MCPHFGWLASKFSLRWMRLESVHCVYANNHGMWFGVSVRAGSRTRHLESPNEERKKSRRKRKKVWKTFRVRVLRVHMRAMRAICRLSTLSEHLDLVHGAHTEQVKHLAHETRRRLADQQTRRLLLVANDVAVAVEIVELAGQLVHKVGEAVEHQVPHRLLDHLWAGDGAARQQSGERKEFETCENTSR